MGTEGKDSPEVVRFMALFAKVKDWIDDDPAALADMAKTDDGLREICVKLAKAGQSLRWSEQQSRVMFASPTNPAFAREWRDFEARYESFVGHIWLWRLEPVIAEHLKNPENQGRTSPEILDWDWADHSAREYAEQIDKAVEFANEEVGDESREFDDDFFDEIFGGVLAWGRLKSEVGFDPRGAFRRRELAVKAFILVPRHVAAKHDSPEKADMFRNLYDAYTAFVFGALRASVAMMRSIIEVVLRDHYRASGKDLCERINNVRGLPVRADRKALHRLRRLAIRFLHLPEEGQEEPIDLEQGALERAIAVHLIVIRDLIEGAPIWT